MTIRRFLRDRTGASAAEFALVVPIMLLFLLGIIDVGRYMWNVNQVEKATQIGARWLVATDYIAPDINDYSFSISGGIGQGTVVPEASFPGVSCTSSSAGTVTCSCKKTCTFLTNGQDQAAFNALVGRMNGVYGAIGSSNVDVDYDYSGLGYAGDPFGSDVDPIVTVTARDIPFRPLFLGSLANLGLPPLSYSLTMEDGQGDYANY